jgi:acyl carrier protein phosphodiesterase
LNFIAHLLLSGYENGVIVGNFIADSIKGKNYIQYPSEIQKGILFHRQIDFFTDTHYLVRKSKLHFVEKHKHYAGVLVDIYYDHILMQHWKEYSNESKKEFSDRVTRVLLDNWEYLPEFPRMFLNYNQKHDSINHYHELSKIKLVLEGMTRRIGGRIDLATSIDEFEVNALSIEQDFLKFFEELRKLQPKND